MNIQKLLLGILCLGIVNASALENVEVALLDDADTNPCAVALWEEDNSSALELVYPLALLNTDPESASFLMSNALVTVASVVSVLFIYKKFFATQAQQGLPAPRGGDYSPVQQAERINVAINALGTAAGLLVESIQLSDQARQAALDIFNHLLHAEQELVSATGLENQV